MIDQFELNQICSKFREHELDEQFINRYIDKLNSKQENYVTISKVFDSWRKKDSGQFVLQSVAFGLIEALAGDWFFIVR